MNNNLIDQEKGITQHIESSNSSSVENVEKTSTNYIDDEEEPEISEEHKQYLIKKHGTYNLIPLPTMDDNNPLNWSNYQKILQLSMVSFHAFMATFMASGVVPAFGELSVLLGHSTHQISYLTSCQIILIGSFPMVWTPVMNRYGKRLLLIISVFGSMCFSIGCVFCKDYESLIALRCISAIFISPGLAVGGAIVSETTFSHQRGSRSGVWSIMVNLGTMFGPLLMGFVAQFVEPKYIFVVFAAINFVQMIAYIFLGKETSYNLKDKSRNIINPYKQIFRKNAIYPENKISIWIILNPFKYLKYWKIFIPTFGYTILFMHGNIALNVQIPQVMYTKYGLGPMALGLQFIGFIIGTIIGEIGGYLSDKLLIWGKKNGKGSSFRLWLTYPGYIFCIVGLIVFGVVIDQTNTYHVKTVVGLAISAFGLQVSTSPIIAYCIDQNSKDASSIVLFITFIRQLFAFIGPFYYPIMFSNIGFTKSYSIMAALVGAFGLIPTLILQFYESRRGR
ncbi:uncharacterized protein KGF55_003597 [Candida pseudojiufengensis]|uniref:uncharacterized protein n=1 Tax=Candida pseudojiufengensis TaxID=497109 RepID=UPI0022244457|nr:uncharacterized protein KGF55_003597 [Candida pseudojiufengensis]KAI5962521.1 hypothetical protein KGF55_003597 [Candida pseudojiufengensis]